MTTVPNHARRAVPPFATWNLDELEAAELERQAAERSADRWEAATIFLAVAAVIVIAYFVSVGVVATAISQGWSA